MSAKFFGKFLGIDPGLDGFLCLLSDGRTGPKFWPMPTLAAKKGRVIDEGRLAAIVGSLPEILLCVVEIPQIGPKQGKASILKTGDGYGLLRGMLVMRGIGFEKIRPQDWKEGLGIPKVGGAIHDKTKQRKEVSIAHAQSLFPKIDLRANPETCKVPHDGKAEALLLAEYARRRWSGGA